MQIYENPPAPDYFSETSTTFPSETKSLLLTGHKREAFLRILKDEIMQIEHLPLENSAFLIQKDHYAHMVEHLETEKQQKLSISGSNSKDATLMLKPQVFFDGNEQIFTVKS